MAQGTIKKSKPSAVKTSQRKQTGARIIKPKKAALLKRERMKKKHSGGLTAMTEKTLAGKAGHLEILRGGKKDAKAQAATKDGGKGKGR